jgi:xylulokinase
MTRLLGLDVGTSSVKGIAIDGDGAVLAVAERGYPLSTPRPGWSEQDPEDWWRGAAEVLEELDAANAAGIGLSGQMHGLVALDQSGRPLRPAILWNDGRTQAQCDEIEERIGFERLVQLTGCGWPSTSPRSTGASRTSCCPRTTSGSSSPTSTP